MIIIRTTGNKQNWALLSVSGRAGVEVSQSSLAGNSQYAVDISKHAAW